MLSWHCITFHYLVTIMRIDWCARYSFGNKNPTVVFVTAVMSSHPSFTLFLNEKSNNFRYDKNEAKVEVLDNDAWGPNQCQNSCEERKWFSHEDKTCFSLKQFAWKKWDKREISNSTQTDGQNRHRDRQIDRQKYKEKLIAFSNKQTESGRENHRKRLKLKDRQTERQMEREAI